MRCSLSPAALLLVALGCSGAEPEPPAAKASSAPLPEPAPSGSAALAASAELPALDSVPNSTPLVDLSGQAQPLPVTLPGAGPRVYARALKVWIHQAPDRNSRRLGYLRSGGSSPTRGGAAGHADCPGGWYPIAPAGYVCVGRRATLDGSDPVVVATREHRPDHERPLPYIYGTVRRPGPIYRRLPTPEELKRAEPDIDKRMPEWLDAPGEVGASYAQHVWLGRPGELPDPRAAWESQLSQGVPEFLRGNKVAPSAFALKDPQALSVERMRPKVGFSFLETFLHEGRRYGVTPDLRILPTDRLRPIQGSRLTGHEIPKDIDFPFAIVRKQNAHRYIFKADGGRLVKHEPATHGAAIKLTGKQRFFNKVLHYETGEGHWLSDREASRLDPAKRMPKWGTQGEKWIDVNLSKQTVVLYEGTRPVYATLISSGEAGLEDHRTSTATKRGIFRIHTKHITTTMSSDEAGEEFELRDVPYVMYFEEGYAMHGAYWHDRFGTPKSHGCLNLSPEDARRIFHWTDPQVPPGWHGALLPLKGTILFVHP
ncbi:MAG: L,D-transpeptidase [Polyangiaceae bacterium]|nr:L,D-transpeptidase [Polyangiaceae bacterium]MCW5791369.1 L,D-transpeptidase [Polyangiaceae bacterium]